jgi:UDP-N-acetylmuramoylalanine--D-glutamate ligase
MNRNAFNDKRIVVMGLGLHGGGLGVAKWLLARGARLLVTDLRDRRTLASSIAALERAYAAAIRRGARAHRPRYVLGRHRLRDFREADMIIRNPGVPVESPFLAAARKAGLPVESDMSIFFHLCPQPIVGVSGTKGKTTVTSLIGGMLKAGFGRAVVAGNIRKSPLDALDALMRPGRAVPVALELSSWHLESLEHARHSPQVAVLTNVLPDHLNRYRSMRDYAAAKELIYAFQRPADFAVVPLDDRWTRKMGARVRGRRVWASMRPLAGEENALFFRRGAAVLRLDGAETVLFHLADVRLPGAHNRWNALLAAGASRLRGVPLAAIRRALRAFKGVPHRLELVRTVRGVEWWNDTAATAPDASIAAMETLFAEKKGVLIAGGADKKLEFSEWARVAKRRIKALVLFEGAATDKMLSALKNSSPRAKRSGAEGPVVVRTMAEAVRAAARLAKAGDRVVLSPAAASFGLFLHEFDRGDKFRAAVRRLH